MEKAYLTTPVSRLVAGDLVKPRVKDAEGNPLIVKSGPRTGQPREEFFIALAMPKSNPETAAFIEQIRAIGKAAFPMQSEHFTFAWKLTDGDSDILNSKGIAPCTREGYPGHWVLSCSGGFAPTLYDDATRPATADLFYRGCYLRASVSVSGNGSQQRPGLFIGATMVQFCGHGEKISTGLDAAQIFAAPIQLPPGASATPLAPASPLPPAPAAPVAPPPPIAAPPPPPVAVAVRYNIGGQIFDEADLLAKGWTREQLAAFPKA